MRYLLDWTKDPQAQDPCLPLAHSRAMGPEVPQKFQREFLTRPAAGVLSL